MTLRYVDDALATEVALLSSRGVHDPSTMPFTVPWTDLPADEIPMSSLLFLWGMRAATTPAHFHLSLAVIADGAVVGVSSLGADDFASVRQFTTGSWLGVAHQGRGLGRELREATLHLGFAGLDAVRAHSAAFADNERSNRVSRRLRYRENGRQWLERRGEPAEQIMYVMDRDTWESQRRDDITIEGIERVRAYLGID